MIPPYKDLTVITITYNNVRELLLTYRSVTPLINKGASLIIVNGGEAIENSLVPAATLINEVDSGIYDALNKGLKYTQTSYVSFIHSGDSLISETNFYDLFSLMIRNQYDLVFGSTIISGENKFRRHSSRYWKPWMLSFYAQPPHLSAIYKTDLYENRLFRDKLKIVGDFYMFKEIFNESPRYLTTNIQIVHQLPDGKSSNVLDVTREFVKYEKSIMPILLFPIRIFLKILMMMK